MLIGAIVVLLVLVVVGFLFWQAMIATPLYTPGMVRAGTNLRAPLDHRSETGEAHSPAEWEGLIKSVDDVEKAVKELRKQLQKNRPGKKKDQPDQPEKEDGKTAAASAQTVPNPLRAVTVAHQSFRGEATADHVALDGPHQRLSFDGNATFRLFLKHKPAEAAVHMNVKGARYRSRTAA